MEKQGQGNMENLKQENLEQENNKGEMFVKFSEIQNHNYGYDFFFSKRGGNKDWKSPNGET